jgi:hypothetical protein
MNNNYFNSKPDSVFSAARNVLSDDDQPTLVEAEDYYFRLPGNVINNELYVAGKTMQQIISTANAGDDFDEKVFNKLLSLLRTIKKEVKAFKVGTEPPVSYQYKAKA